MTSADRWNAFHSGPVAAALTEWAQAQGLEPKREDLPKEDRTALVVYDGARVAAIVRFGDSPPYSVVVALAGPNDHTENAASESVALVVLAHLLTRHRADKV